MSAAGEPVPGAGIPPDDRSGLGRAREIGRDHEGAVAAYRQALRRDRQDGDSWFGLARALRRLGRLTAAIVALENAIALGPDNAARRYLLAQVLAIRNRWRDAAARFLEAACLAPGYWAAHHNMAACCEQAGELERAESAAALAVALNPGHWHAQLGLGKLRQALGRWREAEVPLAAAIKLKPRDWNGHFALGFGLGRRRADTGDLGASVLTADEAGTLSVDARPAPKRNEAAVASILIAFKRDNPERVDNIATVLTILERTLPRSTIHVVELGTERHVPIRDRLVYRRIDEAGRRFNRPGVFNLMARDCMTDAIVLYDADTLIPADQMSAAIALACDGGADLVYPFDGRCIDLGRAAIPEILADAPIGNWNRHWQSIRPFNIGSACVWNRRSFVAAGMENERLVGWRLDDTERLVRAPRLGLRVARIEGPAYHLSHPRGQGSDSEAWVDANGREIERLVSMSRATLRDHVGQWPWVAQANEP
jgi:Flp pilus assembly protein TadD